MNFYALTKFNHEICKNKRKENRSCTGNPRVFRNHATAHKYYSYEFWLRIWNPELFLILTRGPCLLLLPDNEPREETTNNTANRGEGRGLGFGHRLLVQGAARPWPWPAAAMPCPDSPCNGSQVVPAGHGGNGSGQRGERRGGEGRGRESEGEWMKE